MKNQQNEALICQCCGGHINRTTYKCEYCGTQYKSEQDQIIRIETYHNPVRSIKSSVRLDHKMVLQLGPEAAAEIVMREITRELSKSLAPFIKLTNYMDYRTCQNIVDGEIKIVQPIND